MQEQFPLKEKIMDRSTLCIAAVTLLFGVSMADVARADGGQGGHGYMHGYGWHMGQGQGQMAPGYGRMGPGYGPGGPGYGHMGPGYQGMGRGGRMMGGYGFRGRQIDANDNGVISDAEAARHFESRFVVLDADSDGALTRDEFLRFRPPFWAGDRAALETLEKRYEARLTSMDSNKDGKVEKGEYMAFHRKQFAAADSNKDGKVGVWEYRSQRRR
jgi:Ca2+-binding EF-hand superfamily protein